MDTLILYRKLPKIIYYQKWDYKEYTSYLEWRYGKKIKKKSCKRNRLQDLLCRSPSRTRTYDSAVNSRVLYRLSYRGILADTQLPVKPIINKLYLQNFTQNPSIKPTNIIRYIWSSPRSISNSQLHTLPCFHLCPIYLVVFKGSYFLMEGISHLEGGFTLRCLQRLSLPDLATLPCRWSTADTPVVRPSRSSRTKDSSSQISSARAG